MITRYNKRCSVAGLRWSCPFDAAKLTTDYPIVKQKKTIEYNRMLKTLTNRVKMKRLKIQRNT